MPGPIATEVLALVRATISKFKSIEEVHTDVDNAAGLPPAFQDVGQHIPTVYHALETAKDEIRQRRDDNTCAGMKPSVEGCKRKAACLEALFMKVVPSVAAEKMECYRMAVRELGEGSRVETLMRDAMEDVKLLLTVDDEMTSATKSQLESLIESMKEVSAIPQSMEDESSALGIYNYGSGPQNVNTGSGPQNNNNGEGVQVNGGTFQGINPFLRQ